MTSAFVVGLVIGVVLASLWSFWVWLSTLTYYRRWKAEADRSLEDEPSTRGTGTFL